jgi:UTP:GlnB (protein PII) uridylyltransferase
VDAPLPIVVESYSIDRDAERGVLVVELRGLDRVGFLGSLLERLSGLLLFPVEMQIEPAGASVVDRFSLQALGGGEPSLLAERSLAALLDQLR